MGPVIRRSLAVALMTLAMVKSAHADGALGPNGSSIRTSNYAVDLTSGPLLLGTRALGLGGAYVAVAEDVDGMQQNPATPAVRAWYSDTMFSYDLGFGIVPPSAMQSSDFFNTGRPATDVRHTENEDFALLLPALVLQWGDWGIGVSGRLQRYDLEAQPGLVNFTTKAQLSDIRGQLARAVDDGQFVGGIGLLVTALDLTSQSEIFTRSGTLFTSRGAALEAGFLVRPHYRPFRIGVGVRAPVSTMPTDPGRESNEDYLFGTDETDPNALWLPRSISFPWNLDVGIAWQFGPRPFNIPFRPNQKPWWPDPNHTDREAYLMLTASVHLDGQVRDGVGVESFLNGIVDRSGQRVTVSPRIGAETEPILGWTRVRVGSYLEPSRFETGRPRAHGTLGLDVKLFEWRMFGAVRDHTSWRITGVVDIAPRYSTWSFSGGIWH